MMKKPGWLVMAAARWICVFTSVAVTGTENLVNQQDRPWQPKAPAVQLPIWPEGLPIAPPATPGQEG